MISLAAQSFRFDSTTSATLITTVDSQVSVKKLQFKVTVTGTVATKNVAVYLDTLMVQQQHMFGNGTPINVDAFKNWTSLRYEGSFNPGQTITIQLHVNELPGPYEYILVDVTFRGKRTTKEKELDNWFSGIGKPDPDEELWDGMVELGLTDPNNIPDELIGRRYARKRRSFGRRVLNEAQKIKQKKSICKTCRVKLKYLEHYGVYCPKCFDRPEVEK